MNPDVPPGHKVPTLQTRPVLPAAGQTPPETGRNPRRKHASRQHSRQHANRHLKHHINQTNLLACLVPCMFSRH
jgi:hypothetical protein